MMGSDALPLHTGNTNDERLPYWRDMATQLSDQLDKMRADMLAAREAARVMSAKVDTLTAHLREQQRHHEADIRLISQRALRAAVEEDWCDGFDDAVDELNRDLHVKMESRKTNWRVQITVTMDYESVTGEEAQTYVLNKVREAVNDACLTATAEVEDIDEVD